MTSRLSKFLCLFLVLAAVIGMIGGCQNPQISMQSTASTTPGITTHTTPGTTVSTSGNITCPLPSDSAPTVSEPTAPPPTIPVVAIPKLSAKTAFVFDLRTDTFLYSSCDVTTQLFPASTTKLFTAYVALQYLQLDQRITVGSELSYVEWDANEVGFRKGDVVSVEALTYSALLSSGCDASYILAAAAGRKILNNPGATAKQAGEAFMQECNRFAREMGMENTHFVTADGYHDADHYISVQAFAIIAALCLEDTDLARITATDSINITYTNMRGETRTMTLRNTNQTIHASGKYYHPCAVGLKTGYTKAAGHCLLTAYRVEDGYVLVGVFGCKDSEDRFSDANRLFEAFAPHL